jgi:hypothetical protein
VEIRKTQEKLSFFKIFVNLYRYNKKLLSILIVREVTEQSEITEQTEKYGGGDSGEMPAHLRLGRESLINSRRTFFIFYFKFVICH